MCVETAPKVSECVCVCVCVCVETVVQMYLRHLKSRETPQIVCTKILLKVFDVFNYIPVIYHENVFKNIALMFNPEYIFLTYPVNKTHASNSSKILPLVVRGTIDNNLQKFHENVFPNNVDLEKEPRQKLNMGEVFLFQQMIGWDYDLDQFLTDKLRLYNDPKNGCCCSEWNDHFYVFKWRGVV